MPWELFMLASHNKVQWSVQDNTLFTQQVSFNVFKAVITAISARYAWYNATLNPSLKYDVTFYLDFGNIHLWQNST
jgi:hypothetical protein